MYVYSCWLILYLLY